MGNADVIEIFWTALAAAGAVIAYGGMRDAIGDLRELRRTNINSLKKIYAIGAVRREGVRLFVQMIFGFAGIGAMLNPGGARDPWEWGVIVLLMLAAGAINMNSLFDRRMDRRMSEAVLMTRPLKIPDIDRSAE